MAVHSELLGAEETISFLNRDHIVSVVIHRGEIIVTTTAGEKISIPAADATVSKFADEVAHDINSNFVSIPTTAAPAT